MSKPNNGLSKTLAAFNRLKDEPRKAVLAALEKSANELADAQRALAPGDTGALKRSIVVTKGGQSTPAYSQPGGSMMVPADTVAVTVGNTDVRYPHLVEYGTSEAEAQPFFWPAFRLLRAGFESRHRRVGRKAIRDSWKG